MAYEWVQKWGNVSDIAVAISSCLTLFAAIFIGWRANEIAKYQSKQAHRDIIENIYLLYFEAMMELTEKIDFPQTVLSKIVRARGLAKLYNEKEIESDLTKTIEDFNLGKYTLSESIRLSEVEDKSYDRRQKYMNIYSDLVYSERSGKTIKLFQKRIEELG